MRILKAVLMSALSVLSLNAIAMNVNMKVNFLGQLPSGGLTRVTVESGNIECSGESSTLYPYGYIYTGSSFDGSRTLNIGISGIFEGDYRNSCKIYYDDGSFDKVYFTMNNLVISYYKNGDTRKYTCSIDGLVGTSFDRTSTKYDKLQAQYRNIENYCSKSSDYNNDTYKITPGHAVPWNPGQITINLK